MLVAPLARGSVAGDGVAVVTWVQVAMVSVMRSFVMLGMAVPTSLFLPRAFNCEFSSLQTNFAYQMEVTTLLASTMTEDRTSLFTDTLVALAV